MYLGTANIVIFTVKISGESNKPLLSLNFGNFFSILHERLYLCHLEILKA